MRLPLYNWLIKYYYIDKKYYEKKDPVDLYGTLSINIFIKQRVPWKFEKVSKSVFI